MRLNLRTGISGLGCWRRLLPHAAALLLLGGLYGPSFVNHAANSTNLLRCTDDVRQHIPPFLSEQDPALFVDDYVSDYIVAIRPWGFQALYRGLARLVDPREVCDLIVYPLLILTVGLCGLAAGRLAGPAAGWVTVALALSSEWLIDRMSGGLPRTFAFPCFAAALMCLAWGRMIAAAVCIVLAAAFYPTAGVSAGMALALVLLVMPAPDRGRAETWGWRKRLALVAATAALSLGAMWPTLQTSHEYGPIAFDAEDAEVYPELSARGRLHRMDRLSYSRSLVKDIWELGGLTLRNDGEAWSGDLRAYMMKGDSAYNRKSSRLRRLKRGVFVVLGLGACILAAGSAAGRRVLALFLSVCVAFVFARTFPPYLFLPHRHLYYPMPILFLIGIPVCTALVFRALLRRLPSRRQPPEFVIRHVPVVAVGAALLLLVGGRFPDDDHIKGSFKGPEMALLQRIADLPPDALVAGWPSGPVQNVPYVSARPALVTRETHLTWHQAYMDEMRRRMGLFLRAYYAIDSGPLIDLREQYGVTHMIVDERHFRRGPPSYFEPFNGWARDVFELADGHYEILQQRDRAAVWRDGHLWLADLGRIR